MRSLLSKLFNQNAAASFRTRRILMAATSAIGSRAVNMLVMILSVPLTYNHLGDERFGMLMTILSFLAMMGFADLGLGLGLFNRIAKYQTEKDHIMLSKAISSTFIFLSSLALILFIIFILVYPNVTWHKVFNVTSTIAQKESSQAILVFMICFLGTLPFSIIRKIQSGYQQSHINEYWDAAGNTFSLAMLFLVVKLNYGVPLILLALYGSKSLFIILNFSSHFIFFKSNTRPQISLCEKKVFLGIFQEGLMFFILQILAMVSFSSDTLIIAQYKGAEFVAIFAIGYRLFTIFMVPIQSFIYPVLPAINDAIAKRDLNWIKEFLRKTIPIILLISSVMSIFFYCAGNSIIRLWIDPKAIVPLNLMFAFSVFILFSNLNAIISQVLLSSKFIKQKFKIYFLPATLAITLKLVFINSWGIDSVLWSTMIAFSIFYFIPGILIIRSGLSKSH